MKLLPRQIVKSQSGTAPVLILVAILGLVIFLAFANLGSFKDRLFSLLYPKPASYAAGSYTLVGTHPFAAAQSTAQGKILAALYPFNGKLYVGFGDYGANTGPINIAPYDPATNTFSSSFLASNTESINNFREINGSLYAPAIDPRGSVYNYLFAKGEPWNDAASSGVDGEHIFDVVSLTGTDLIAVGSGLSSGSVNAAVWRTTDGTNWAKILETPPINASSGGAARYYFAGIYNNKLYVQARDDFGTAGNNIQPQSKIFDGTAWTNGPNLFSSCTASISCTPLGWRPQTFAGKMVYKSWPNPGWGYLEYFDGTKDYTVTAFGINDFTINNGYLYALGSDGIIRRTTNLTSWEVYATAPVNHQSLAILNDILYIGTTDSKLYKYSESTNLVSPTPSASLVFSPAPSAPASASPSPSPVASAGPVDTIIPTISITAPIAGATLTRNSSFRISVSATDNVAVGKVEFYVDNALKCTDTSSAYDCQVKIGGKPGALHNISAKAYDLSGNASSATVTIKTK